MEFEEKVDLIHKAARMLLGYQAVIPEKQEAHVLLTAVALGVFEEMQPERAIRFTRENWSSIEEAAFALDVTDDIKSLDIEDDRPEGQV